MYFELEEVNTSRMISKCIHGSWHKAMTLPYYLTNTFDLTLNNLIIRIEDDLKVLKNDVCYETTTPFI